ncbi:MAG TPA: proton-conducting transporter membrane subunit, partial [Bryobacteraceae bacterium]|nr:proton-conducting transporter membrane subunit [Bryobacteraceae bacterium]
MLPLLVLSPFLLIPAAAWLGRRRARYLALWPAALTVYFGTLLTQVSSSGPLKAELPWAPSLGLTLSFYFDGLSLLFAVLIAGIGSLIVVFSHGYFGGQAGSGRFQATLFAFMGSMLGVVLADNLIALFVFWELTSFTSFLLIGFENEKPEARAAAIQAFIVTGTGGMALLAVAVLIQQTSGRLDLSALLADGTGFQNAAVYPAIAVLLLLAAFTKSAQFPFHFWLPNAMAAPTPVSAYLHSATMVKAGIYLVARMTPLAGGTALWSGLVAAVGAITMAVGAWRALTETDLKRVLAYSTVSALGLIMMLLGVGAPAAIGAALVYLVAHACYKGALFLVAGTLEHETGTRDVRDLGGLGRSMPAVAMAGALAAASMAGVPLFLGFTGKELLYGALLGHGNGWTNLLLALAVGASVFLGAAGLLAGVSPFAGPLGRATAPDRVSATLAAPPLILGTIGLIVGLWPGAIDLPIGLAASSVLQIDAGLHLALWHGFNPVLALSALTLALTAVLYWKSASARGRIWPRTLGAERLYTFSLRALDRLSEWSLPALQSASLRSYVLVLVSVAAVMVGAVLTLKGLPPWPALSGVRPQELAAAALILIGAISAVRASSI